MTRSDLIEKIARGIREKITCDATGLSPAVASVFLCGFDDAAEAALTAIREAGYKLVAEDEWEALRGAAPDATGDMTSEDFVRKIRDEWPR